MSNVEGKTFSVSQRIPAVNEKTKPICSLTAENAEAAEEIHDLYCSALSAISVVNTKQSQSTPKGVDRVTRKVQKWVYFIEFSQVFAKIS